MEGGDGKDRQTYAPVFRDFIKKFRAIIDNPVSGHRELTVAIKGYGYFAAVSRTLFELHSHTSFVNLPI